MSVRGSYALYLQAYNLFVVVIACGLLRLGLTGPAHGGL